MNFDARNENHNLMHPATFKALNGVHIDDDDDNYMDISQYQNTQSCIVAGKSSAELLGEFREGLSRVLEGSGSDVKEDMHSITLSRRHLQPLEEYESKLDSSASAVLSEFQFGCSD